ncbi:Cytochrome b-c1 subunit 10 [Cordyceps militaris]|uniref:Cytochrome b-c1 subunit 10 n=1 Tax=Cordyceps militaris TaxID=73501 RepID=A0A2H4SFH4_CORMI|nr:Cytochrome b-c1 subunit 10 [Cordyceps militaris]
MVSATPFRRAEFKSAYGPKYQYQPNFRGWSGQTIFRSTFRLSLFGGGAVVAALLFTSGIPRIQRDILDKIPGMARFYTKEVHPQDNPF